MKKLLLTLIVSLAFGGSIIAQDEWQGFNPNEYESHWSDYTLDPFLEMPDWIVAFLKIDGEYVGIENNWQDMEIAAFVNGELRGTGWMTDEYYYDEPEYAIPYPVFDFNVYYYMASTGESVDFKLYDHSSGMEYTDFSINIDYTTGSGDHVDIYYYDYDAGVIFDFATPEGITKTIIGYEEEGGGWNLIASPVGDVDVTRVQNLAINDFDLYYFNQQGDDFGKEWMNYELGEEEFGFTTLEAGKGYLYANIATVTLSFPGSAYEETGTFDLEYSDANEEEIMHGMNLMGNPFNANATVDRPFYRMGEGDVFVSCDALEEVGPMEGVIVNATAEGQTVTFAPATETGDKGANLALSLSSNGKTLDRAVIGFGQGERLPKLQFNSNSSKVYITVDNKDYAVVRSEGMGEMPVSFKAENNGTYSLAVNSKNVDFSYLHLIDNLTGADQDMLANPSYSFSANTTDYASRFRLVFATANEGETFAFFSNGSLFVNNEGNATLQVVDVTGRIIKCENINGCANVNIDAAPGVYMVRLLNGDNMKVQKVVK